jgi:hypothetical protein
MQTGEDTEDSVTYKALEAKTFDRSQEADIKKRRASWYSLYQEYLPLNSYICTN